MRLRHLGRYISTTDDVTAVSAGQRDLLPGPDVPGLRHLQRPQPRPDGAARELPAPHHHQAGWLTLIGPALT